MHRKAVVALRIVILVVIVVVCSSDITKGEQQLTVYNEESLSQIPSAKTGIDPEPSLLAMNVEGAEDKEELLELMAVLDEETEVATKTKMNADYVPGIVTVVHGEDLEAMGVRTVWEALGLVPGVETRINELGRPLVVVRGIIGSRHTGHLKLMIDSVGANPSFRGVNDALMMIPVEQVERIEVIRGSGSTLYGEFSYTGVINIITRKGGARLYGGVGSFNTYSVGGLYSFADPEKGLKFSINVAGWETDGADVDSGPDAVGVRLNQPDISFSPGATNEDEKVHSLAINLDYKKTGLTFYEVNRKHGAYFGTSYLTPENDGTPMEGQYWHLEARHSMEMSSTLSAMLKANISEDENELDEMLLPPGATPRGGPVLGTGSPLVFLDGHWKTTYVKERRIEGGGDLTWTGWKGHTWFLGLSAAEVEIRDAWEASNVNTSTMPVTIYPTIQRLPGDEDVWIDAGKKRRIISTVLQDQFELLDNFTLTVAARYDKFDDVGSAVTPRIAAVWKLAEPHLFKFQYSEAYRPPTLAELYLPETGAGAHGNPNLEPETSQTYEVGYIYRKPALVGRATLFYTKMEGLITTKNSDDSIRHQPVNNDEAELKGLEVEIEKKFGGRFKSLANLSLFETEDMTNHQDIVNSTHLIGNLILEGKLTDNLLAVINYRHVGDRIRSSTDTRGDLEGYDTVDLTLSHFNLGFKGVTLRAGVKNIFDEEVKAPSNDYQEDLPRAGRTWWTQISYNF